MPRGGGEHKCDSAASFFFCVFLLSVMELRFNTLTHHQYILALWLLMSSRPRLKFHLSLDKSCEKNPEGNLFLLKNGEPRGTMRNHKASGINSDNFAASFHVFHLPQMAVAPGMVLCVLLVVPLRFGVRRPQCRQRSLRNLGRSQFTIAASEGHVLKLNCHVIAICLNWLICRKRDSFGFHYL